MPNDDANDVTKALAAFGAPSIRYHSFGQGQIRPSNVVIPRREAAMPPAQAPELPPDTAPYLAASPEPVPLVRRDVPEASVGIRPEAGLDLPAWPSPAAPPVAPAKKFTPVAQGPITAPPPRPLAEWAPPAGAAMPMNPSSVEPVAPRAAPPPPRATSKILNPIPVLATGPEAASPPAPRAAPPLLSATVPSAPAARPAPPMLAPSAPPRPAPAPSADLQPAPTFAPAPLNLPPVSTPSSSLPPRFLPAATKVPGAAVSIGRSLAEVFELLASAPRGPAQPQPQQPEMFKRS